MLRRLLMIICWQCSNSFLISSILGSVSFTDFRKQVSRTFQVVIRKSQIMKTFLIFSWEYPMSLQVLKAKKVFVPTRVSQYSWGRSLQFSMDTRFPMKEKMEALQIFSSVQSILSFLLISSLNVIICSQGEISIRNLFSFLSHASFRSFSPPITEIIFRHAKNLILFPSRASLSTQCTTNPYFSSFFFNSSLFRPITILWYGFWNSNFSCLMDYIISMPLDSIIDIVPNPFWILLSLEWVTKNDNPSRYFKNSTISRLLHFQTDSRINYFDLVRVELFSQGWMTFVITVERACFIVLTRLAELTPYDILQPKVKAVVFPYWLQVTSLGSRVMEQLCLEAVQQRQTYSERTLFRKSGWMLQGCGEETLFRQSLSHLRICRYSVDSII